MISDMILTAPLDLDLDVCGSPENLATRQCHQLVYPDVSFVLMRTDIFLIFAGIIYDVIVEPPSIGSTTDERGNSKPVSRRALQWRMHKPCTRLNP